MQKHQPHTNLDVRGRSRHHAPMNFASDNTSGAAPEIIEAIVRANEGQAPSYGADDLTAAVETKFKDIFETDLSAYLVATGTAGNSLSLACAVPPFGAVIAHEASHIAYDECNAPEFYMNGAKVTGLSGAHGKLSPEDVDRTLTKYGAGIVHRAQPAALSVAQATEAGTIYSRDEVAALSEICRKHNIVFHMDGARIANAIAQFGRAPAELTWRAGVDVLVFGATKNGALGVEAVIFFNMDLAKEFEFRRKRGGHLFSKGRFLAAQMLSYLEDGLWLRLAHQANEAAQRLARGLSAINGVEICHPVDANLVFAIFPEHINKALRKAGAQYYPWVVPGDQADGKMVRLITNFSTKMKDVDEFLSVAQSAADV